MFMEFTFVFVLILVLLELILLLEWDTIDDAVEYSFNPCFIGTYSFTRKKFVEKQKIIQF